MQTGPVTDRSRVRPETDPLLSSLPPLPLLSRHGINEIAQYAGRSSNRLDGLPTETQRFRHCGVSCAVGRAILAVALGLAIVIMIFLYQPVKVEGTSMNPLLSDQERIFINKFIYRFEPIERGDVVVFWYPLDRSKSFIKRVVALPGETVEIRAGNVYVNGRELPDQYVPSGYLDGSNYPARRIPPGRIFRDGRPSR